MFGNILKTIFGTKSGRDVKKMIPLVAKINEYEESYQKLSDEALKAKTDEFKKRLQQGETLDDIMCEAFAAVKNACRRLVGTKITVCDHELVWDMIPYDVQLMGAIALHNGNISEMQTGEGKTLVATMPLYLNALTGKNCQLVTVNDYLARRDSEWMGTVYTYLGLTVGCLQNMMQPQERREIYSCDITYGTNSEFGFDYLRDMGMATEKSQLVQRDYYYAIVDEIDSILIDEARTPLIISGPVAVSTHQYDRLRKPIHELYNKQNTLCSRMIAEARQVLNNPEASDDDQADAVVKLVQARMGMPNHKQLMHTLEDVAILKRVEKAELRIRSDQNRGMLQEVQSDLFFAMDQRNNEADLTEKGRNAISPDDPEAFILPDLLTNLHDIENDPETTPQEKAERKEKFQEEFAYKSETLQNLSQLLKAYCLFEKDVNYVVMNDQVMIVDEHTGRLMPGRRYSDGLHQALEAKENVTIEKETQTLATITIQNYFRMYEKLAGMTGTAETEANEFHEIYKLDVIVIPTNKPCQRVDTNDSIYKTKRGKFKAIVEDVIECHKEGQPVLLGTVSVEDSELLSDILKRNKIPHNVLNAKLHEQEAEIIARAGERAAVTVATNMAGRGTDIKLGEGVTELGGLHVIGSARHDSRRIDRQLRGRCARQGDPGSSHFYISLEDPLMRRSGSDKVVTILEKFGMDEELEVQNPLLNRSIETTQRRVEQDHFSARKNVLEYDDVMNRQREEAYGFRRQVLLTDTPGELLFKLVEQEIELSINEALIPPADKKVPFDKEYLLNWLSETFPIGFTEDDIKTNSDTGIPDTERLRKHLLEKVKNAYDEKEKTVAPESREWLERHIILDAFDKLWMEHLHSMDHLRSSVGLRRFAQRDPLVEYKREAFKMFEAFLDEVNQEILKNMFRSTVASLEDFEEMLSSMPQEMIHKTLGQFADPNMDAEEEEAPEEMPEINITFVRETPKVGRNDPCPCGSGKKFKKCCGK